MESTDILSRKKAAIDDGRMSKVGSFLAANVSAKLFGSFAIPESVLSGFGRQMPSKVTVICGNSFWKAKFKADIGILDGLRRFVIYYGIKIFCSVRFDYYGDDILTAIIFKENGLECSYPVTDNQYLPEWESGDFVIGSSGSVFRKQKAEWSFNILSSCDKYFTLTVGRSDVNPNKATMRLNEELTKLFNKWILWNTCTLHVCGKGWKIEVIRAGGHCFFGNGWIKFVRDCNVEVGDRLILFRFAVTGAKTMNTIIMKEDKYIADTSEGLSGIFDKSFVKIASANMLLKEEMIVPFMLKETYGSELKKLNKLTVIGNSWNLTYDDSHGCIRGVGGMLKMFKIISGETILFTLTAGHEISARIYRKDGKEIDYVARMFNLEETKSTTSVWTLEFNKYDESDEDSEDNTEMDTDDNNKATSSAVKDTNEVNQRTSLMVSDEGQTGHIQFTKKLQPSNVDKRSHGVIIPREVKPYGRDWVAGDEVTLVTTNGSWKIGIVLSNGSARFSSGWNSFVKENNIKSSNTLVFTMDEQHGRISFRVEK